MRAELSPFRDHQSPVTELIQTWRSIKCSHPYLPLTFPLALYFSFSPVCPLLYHPHMLSAFPFPPLLPTASCSQFLFISPLLRAQPDVIHDRCITRLADALLLNEGVSLVRWLWQSVFSFHFGTSRIQVEGVQEYRLGFFLSRRLWSLCLSLCYFIRTIKGISVQVMGS